MIAHRVTLISKVDPLKYLMTRQMLTGRLARRAFLLTEFDIVYAPQKAIKGQAMAYFLAAQQIPDDSPLAYDFPDEEVLYTEEENPAWGIALDAKMKTPMHQARSGEGS